MYDPEQAGLAALFARLDARDRKAPAPAAPAAKSDAPEPPPAQPKFRDE
jgi:hypothetical protein